MGILTTETYHTQVLQFTLLKSIWINFFTKINVKWPNNWWSKLIGLNYLWWTSATHMNSLTNSALECHTLWAKSTEINAPKSPPFCSVDIAKVMLTNNDFFTTLSLARKNGIFTQIWDSEKNRSALKTKRIHLQRSPSFTKDHVLTKPSMWNSMFNNYIGSAKEYIKKGNNDWLREEVFSCQMSMLFLSSPIRLKSRFRKSNGKCCFALQTLLTWHCEIFISFDRFLAFWAVYRSIMTWKSGLAWTNLFSLDREISIAEAS